MAWAGMADRMGAQEVGSPPVPVVRTSPAGQAASPLRIRSARLANFRLDDAAGVFLDSLHLVGSGVWVHDARHGSGDIVAAGDEVTVGYVGMLTDGTVFDSMTAGNLRFRVGAGQVIRGWDEGIPGMRVGGRRVLVIPPHLAYGRRGAGAIPPDATLVFHVVVTGRY